MSLDLLAPQQGAFHFTASNCIGCHSCEAACSEKNGLPSHVSWRKVGYVESGCFPDYERINISMACNHCDDPVCLQGCPTRAYVKYNDTGAVIQDPDVCFGCQYCTWVCPYGAPVFDPEAGTVSKCNFCVDRQAEGQNPACVDACLGHALDFGKRENLLDDHAAVDTSIPGFPSPSITKPNVRFEFKKPYADRYKRPDAMNLAYEKNGGLHTPQVDQTTTAGEPAPVALASLHSSESPLVAFTLMAQGVVGAFVGLMGLTGTGAAPTPGITGTLLVVMAALLGYGLFTSTMHLGRPQYFYRAMNNLRYSWVSREILFLGGFMTLLLGYTTARIGGLLPPWLLSAAGLVTLLFGVVGIYCMVRIYRIPARPYWDHTHTNISFFKSGLLLGPLGLALALTMGALGGSAAPAPAHQLLLGVALLAALTGCWATRTHEKEMLAAGGEAAAALDRLTGQYRLLYGLRKKLGLALVVTLAVAVWIGSPALALLLTVVALALAIAGEFIERSLFYLVVIPTTMPGAMFLNNKGFEQMARQTGLAQDRAVGVLHDIH